MEKYQSKAIKVLADLKEQKVTIEDTVTMKAMNDLGTAFSTYIMILNENTHNDKNMSRIDKFFKKLENKECQMNQDNTLLDNTVNTVWDWEDCEECEEWGDEDSDRGRFKVSESNKDREGSELNLPYCKLCECNYKSEH